MTQPHYTSILNAAYRLLHNANVDKIADCLNKSANTLRNEVNLNLHGPKLGLVDAMRISEITQDFSLLQACNMYLGHIAIPMDCIDSPNASLLEEWAVWQAAIGKTCATIKEALDDNKITPNELALIEEAGLHKTASFLTLLQSLKAMSDKKEACHA